MTTTTTFRRHAGAYRRIHAPSDPQRLHVHRAVVSHPVDNRILIAEDGATMTLREKPNEQFEVLHTILAPTEETT